MITTSTSIQALAEALTKFQAEVGNVPKEATNPFFKSKYATLDAVLDTAKPVLNKHGLSVAQFPDGLGLTTVLMHLSGEFIASSMELIVKDQTPQSQGSSLTYARRYALSAVLGLATEEDDDANHAEEEVKKEPTKVPSPVKPWKKTKDAAPKPEDAAPLIAEDIL